MSIKRDVTGVLLLDKPAGLSSNSAVGRVKRLFNAAKVGHTGTLDPFATGLLPLALGEASKYSRFLLDAVKGYTAELKLGVTTTTGDPEGEVVSQNPVRVSRPQIEAVLSRFLGIQQQIPPMHSALKQGGVPLYKLARQGIEVERAARTITIEALKLQSWDGVARLTIDVTCSKGTYIRVLAEEIGAALGCGAFLTALRRTRAGRFDIGQAHTLEAIETLALNDRDPLLAPAEILTADLPSLLLEQASANLLGHGRKVPFDASSANPGEGEGEYRVYSAGGLFMGVVSLVVDGGKKWLIPVRLMSDATKAVTTQRHEST